MSLVNKLFPLQRGSSLIEVMVALLILGVGLLGVVSLQTKGLSSNKQGVFVTEAQLLAQDMADRIMAFGSGPQGDNAGGYGGTTTDMEVESVDCSDAAGCTAAEARQYDQWSWVQLADDSSLPRVRGQVTWNAPVYTIEIVWWDQQNNPEANHVVTCATDRCYQMEVRLP